MNIIQYTFTLMMAFSLIFSGIAESKHSSKKTGNRIRKESAQNKKTYKASRSTTKRVNQKAAKTFKKNLNISSGAIKHIKERHWYNANQGNNTSHFSHSVTDQKLSKLAAVTINNGSKKPSKNGQGRSTYQYRFKKPIGTTGNGQKAHSMRVVTDANHNVITAFPVK